MSEESQEEVVVERSGKSLWLIISHAVAVVAGAVFPMVAFQKDRTDLAEDYRDKLTQHVEESEKQLNAKSDQIIAMQQQLVQTQILQFDLLDEKISSALADVVNADVKAGLEKRYLGYSQLVSKYKTSKLDGNVYFAAEKVESKPGVWAGDMIKYGQEVEQLAIDLIRECIENEVQTTFRDNYYNRQPQAESKDFTR